MKTFRVFLALILVMNSFSFAWAKKKKKMPKVEVYSAEEEIMVNGVREFECLHDSSGLLNSDFFKDLEPVMKNLEKTQDTCLPEMDPRKKALLYARNMRNFAEKMKTALSYEALGFNMSDVYDQVKKADERITKLENKGAKQTELLLLDGFAKFIPYAGLPAEMLKGIKATTDFISMAVEVKKKVKKEEKGKSEAISIAEKSSNDAREQLKALSMLFTEMSLSMGRIEDSLTFSSQSKIQHSATDQELMRNLICKFSSKTEAVKFCTGGKNKGETNLLEKRGTLSCDNINAMSESKIDEQVRLMQSGAANAIAHGVVFPDEERGIMPGGTTTRIVITGEMFGKVGDENAHFKNRKVDIDGPGGKNLICAILKSPAYDKYFDGNTMKKKPVLKTADLGLPIAIDFTREDFTDALNAEKSHTKAQLQPDGKWHTHPKHKGSGGIAHTNSRSLGDFSDPTESERAWYYEENVNFWNVPVHLWMPTCNRN